MDRFKQLPDGIKAMVLLGAGGTVIGPLFLLFSDALLVLGIGVIGVILALGAFLLTVNFIKKKKASQMGGALSEHSSGAPRSISEPAHRARLDDLRRNFEQGVDRFRQAGKDIYGLPWYLIVGEPGSGKTEAIRHCNVGFPPGLQDEFQGVGGTINMNWWFTNHAVLLDTAGRLMFEEVEPGQTSEWREFLALLRKNRPNCPVNGMMLIIPVDSLIKDTADQIQRKAGKIAQQLDLIQRALDIRFPVYVVITKCDLINGFREFFDEIGDVNLQHQIVGWSNPDPLDQPFRPELVDQHLDKVNQRIKQRRLNLLKDPAPRSSAGRRTDEVDSLFSFPHSLALIAPRLRRYLEMIFVAGEWSAKPLFLRGIYFSSAMREGSALDQELAEAIGISVDDLPEGKAWEKERAYFLRDLFLEKTFKERGLVTRATNTKKLVRKRQLALYGVAATGLIAILGFSWFGHQTLKDSVGRQKDLFEAGLTNWGGARGIAIVYKDGREWAFEPSHHLTVAKKDSDLLSFHQELLTASRQEVRVPAIYSPWHKMRRSGNPQEAQRILFEKSVLRPLLNEARRKMETDTIWDERSELALQHLMMIEIENHTPTATAKVWQDAFPVLVEFLSGPLNATKSETIPAYQELLASTYTKTAPKNHWGSSEDAIRAGMERFEAHAETQFEEQQQGTAQLVELRAVVRKIDEADRALLESVESEAWNTRTTLTFQQHLNDLEKQVQMATMLPQSNSAEPSPPLSLHSLYEESVAKIISHLQQSFHGLNRSLAVPEGPPILDEMRKALEEANASLTDRAKDLFNASELEEFKELDRELLNHAGESHEPLYLARLAVYRDLEALIDPPQDLVEAISSPSSTIGKVEEILPLLQQGIGAARTSANTYAEAKFPRGDLVKQLSESLLQAIENQRRNNFVGNYLAEAKRELAAATLFPLVKQRTSEILTMPKIQRLQEQAKAFGHDFSLLKQEPLTAEHLAEIERFEQQIEAISPILDFLSESSFKITVVDFDTEERKLRAEQNMAGGDVAALHRTHRLLRLSAEDPAGIRLDQALERTRFMREADISGRLPPLQIKESVERGVWETLSWPTSDDWAVLDIIGQRPPEDDGTTWIIPISHKQEMIGSNPRTLFLFLQLSFEKPVPEQWRVQRPAEVKL